MLITPFPLAPRLARQRCCAVVCVAVAGVAVAGVFPASAQNGSEVAPVAPVGSAVPKVAPVGQGKAAKEVAPVGQGKASSEKVAPVGSGKAAPEVAPVKGASAASAQVSGATLRPGAPAVEVLNRGAGESALLPRAINGVGAAALAQMRAGQLSAEAAYQSGALSMAEVLKLLEQTSEWGALWWGDDEELRRSLGVLVARHAPEKLEGASLDALPLAVRLWVGEALANAGDARAVTVLGSVIDELRGRAPLATMREAAAAFLASERLAWYYRDTYQHEKEAQMWLELPTLLADTPLYESTKWMLPDALIGAARAYNTIGEEDKARELYAQVPQYGHEWFTELATYEQAALEMQRGNSVQGRQILQQSPLASSPTAQLAMSSVVAHSYYVDGEFAKARKLFTRVVDQTQTTQDSKDERASAIARVSRAKEHLRLIEQWIKTPFVCEPSQLSVLTLSLEIEPVTRWLYVSSFRDVPLKFESNNPFVTVKEGQKQWEYDEQLQYDQEFEVTVTAEARQSAELWLTVTSARFPGVRVQVPVQLTSSKGGDQIEKSSEKAP